MQLLRWKGQKLVLAEIHQQHRYYLHRLKFPLTLTNYAPVSLLDPYDEEDFTNITGWGLTGGDFDYKKYHFIDRFFLLGQELLLGEPWKFSEIGIFVIDETFSTLRFDGLQWHY